MKHYKIAGAFSSGTDYEIFRDNYCENDCVFHKEREDGFAEFVAYGGCPVEDGCEQARFDEDLFPTVLLEIWEQDKCVKFHHCPFYTKKKV